MDFTNIFVLLLSDNVFCSAPGTAKKIIDKNVEIVPPKQKRRNLGGYFFGCRFVRICLVHHRNVFFGFPILFKPGGNEKVLFSILFPFGGERGHLSSDIVHFVWNSTGP